MRLLLVFLCGTVAALLAIAALDWEVDPFGEFAKPAAIQAAERSQPACYISRDLFRNAQLPFKLGLFRSRPTRTIVLGTSRVSTMAARPGERSFTNLALLAGHLSDDLWLLQRMPARPRLTVYLGVEVFWFGSAIGTHDYAPGLLARAEYSLSWSTFTSAVHVVRDHPSALYTRWHRTNVGGRCLVGDGELSDAWGPDGTFVWRELFYPQGGTVDPVTVPALKSSYFANMGRFSTAQLAELKRLLALAHARGWRVVGFAPPYPDRYVRRLRASPDIDAVWRRFARVMPRVFGRYGYRWLDFSDASSIPCSAQSFVDVGFHADAACAARIRARLERAARGA